MVEKGRIVNAETSLHPTNAAVLLNQPMAAEGHIINSKSFTIPTTCYSSVLGCKDNVGLIPQSHRPNRHENDKNR